MNLGHCVDFSNKLAIQYNERLKDLLDELNESLKGAIFVYANVYDLAMDIITNYDKYGKSTLLSIIFFVFVTTNSSQISNSSSDHYFKVKYGSGIS